MTQRFRFEWLLGAAAMFGLGVLGGVRLPHADEAAAIEEAADDAPQLDDQDLQRLERLGVRVGQVALTSYAATTPVRAVIEPLPQSHRIVHAPIGGRVTELHVRSHQHVVAGDRVVTMLREPLPRPSLTITSNVLTPAQESRHEAIRDLRARALEVNIIRSEMKRITELQATAPEGVPVVSPQRLVDLRYDLARAETALLGAREEAEKHGLDEEQIAAVAAGAHGPAFDGATWRAALTRNGLWSDRADALFESLPSQVQSAPWAIATIGELVAGGLADERLGEWLAADAAAAEHFLDIGVLLQRGYTLEDLIAMHAMGAFEPIVVVHVQSLEDVDSFDVDRVHVLPGATVRAGDPLVDVDALGMVRLAIDGLGSERALLADAAASGARLVATPLIPGVGPELRDVTITFLAGAESGGRDGGRVARAYAHVPNSVIRDADGEFGERYRTWALRPGMDYVVHVESRRFEQVFVLPVEAVTRRAGQSAVLVREGRDFHHHAVDVLYRDETSVVVRPDGGTEVVDGDYVVIAGVLEIEQALSADDAGAGAHAHHGHSH